MRWVGQPVYKLVVARDGRETQIRGHVMTYCPSSARYVLLYADGSSDGVPVDEIGDHVPLLRQLPAKRRSSKKRRAENRSEERAHECHEPTPPPMKRPKPQNDDKLAATGAAAPSRVCDIRVAVARFVRGSLWELTAALNVSDDKQRALLTTLDNRNEQPLAALERYVGEGGLDALIETLRACGEDGRGEAEAKEHCHSEKRDAKGKCVPRRAAIASRTISPCDQHLRELLSGSCSSVFSPKPVLPKEHHAPCKREPDARKSQHSDSRRPKKAPALHKTEADAPPAWTPVLVDLTNDVSEEEEDEEEINATPHSARRRLHFGLNSTVLFDTRESVDVFRLQMRRARHERAKVPKQNPEIWKSTLKACTRGQNKARSVDPWTM
ncbi:hypothetical protein PHYPSEUDO_009566 [Phytophthora pseudosyringae]|uniref:Uncharacterized protein n=1 Tax=Phytophthora pseudosyringae TaxID=221518 RepID=A0A8T1WGU6_9STRA|nr:hypothetical protein PHYPSEUDO_009566 [Phytophthora pseudosyringae]